MVTIENINSSISNRDRSFVNLAMKIAESSDCSQKHGAVVVRGGSVLAIGYNKMRNRETALENMSDIKNHATVHAEMDALSRVANPRGCTVYVARINSRGQGMFSRPCDHCYCVMVDAGIKRVIYTS